jgi:hypothetical protein
MADSDFVSRLIVPITIGVAFSLMRRYLPVPTAAELPTDFSVENLNERFRPVQWMVATAMVLVGVTFAWIIHKCLVDLNLFFAARDGTAQFQLLPSPWIWWFFPGFGAIALSWEITLSIWSLVGDHDMISQYILWSNIRSGFNATKLLRWMAFGVVLPIGILTLLAVPMHSSLLSEGLCVREYASLSSHQHPYTDARRVAVVRGFRNRDGNFQQRAEVLIKFADGHVWSSAANRDFDKQVDPNLVAFLEQKTGLQAEEAETQVDLSPLF